MVFEWKDSNGQPYLYINADTHYDLGVATGKGLIDQISAAQMMNHFIPKILNTSLEEFISVGKEYLPFIPEKYQEEIRGMAEGASEAAGREFTFDDILIQALSLEILYGRFNFDPGSINLEALTSLQACTCFGAVNQDGSVVMGQNYDAPVSSGATMAWVQHKVADEPWVFSARLGGVPAMPVGKNEHGLAMILNVVISNVSAPAMKPRFVRARETFANCKTAQEAYNVMYENNEFPFSLNMMISDAEKIIGTQIMPQEIRPSYVRDVMVQANKYDYADWQKFLIDPDYSLERYKRAETSLSDSYHNKKKLTNEMLLDIMRDSPIICRDEEADRAQTVAFMTRESFGLGNARGNVGEIPV